MAEFECTGKQLALMIKTNAKAALSGTHGIMQVSGLRYACVVEANKVAIACGERTGADPNSLGKSSFR
jgi:hypothetical protein